MQEATQNNSTQHIGTEPLSGSELRPIGQLIKDSFNILKENFFKFILITLPLILGFIFYSLFGKSIPSIFDLIFIFLTPLIGVALINSIGNREDTIGKCFSVAFRKFFSYLGLSIVYFGLAILAFIPGMFLSALVILAIWGQPLSAPAPGLDLAFLINILLFIIPELVILVFFSLIDYILILENKGIFYSLAKSREYVRGYWWPVFGRLLLVFIIYTLLLRLSVGDIIFFPEDNIELRIIIVSLLRIIFVIFSIFYSIYLYLIYLDLKKIKQNIVIQSTRKYKIVSLVGVFVTSIIFIILFVFLNS